jgi:energy-coupling factor transport system permease protein
MKVFLYAEGDSFLHRLNPLTKLAVAGFLLLVLTAVGDPITPLVLIGVILVSLSWLGRLRLIDLGRILLPAAILGLGLIWTTALFYVASPGSSLRTLFAWGPIVVSDQGLAYALTIFLRLQGFLAASLLFVLTTDPTDVVQALIQKFRLSYRFGYGTLAAYNFVPRLESDLATIQAAHRIRGVDDRGGPIGAMRRYAGYLVPLLAGAVRRADRVALAMESRGFGAFPTRTYYRRSTFSSADVVFGVGTLAAVTGIIVALQLLGWLGQLVPPFLR